MTVNDKAKCMLEAAKLVSQTSSIITSAMADADKLHYVRYALNQGIQQFNALAAMVGAIEVGLQTIAHDALEIAKKQGLD